MALVYEHERRMDPSTILTPQCEDRERMWCGCQEAVLTLILGSGHPVYIHFLSSGQYIFNLATTQVTTSSTFSKVSNWGICSVEALAYLSTSSPWGLPRFGLKNSQSKLRDKKCQRRVCLKLCLFQLNLRSPWQELPRCSWTEQNWCESWLTNPGWFHRHTRQWRIADTHSKKHTASVQTNHD